MQQYEWDETKYQTNLAKHGLGFELVERFDWSAAKIEIALKVALLENLALKPRKAFGPLRVAATGASISPPLFESLELLGRDRSLRRLRAGRDRAAAHQA